MIQNDYTVVVPRIRWLHCYHVDNGESYGVFIYAGYSLIPALQFFPTNGGHTRLMPFMIYDSALRQACTKGRNYS